MADDSPEVTTVKVRKDTWRDLNKRKDPGDTFDDVISRLLEEDEEGNQKTAVVAN